MIPVVRSNDCLLHDPLVEMWIGMSTPAAEVPDRMTVIERSLCDAGHPIVEATAHDDSILRVVHDPALLTHLETVWSAWVEGGYVALGATRVVPYMFPSAELLHGLPLRPPAALHARAGLYCYDTMTSVGPGTWTAARAAVDCALTAVDLVTSGNTMTAYALCRPPGHHVTRSSYGGSCYLNNAAVAAAALRAAGHDRVAIIDVDAHHGNGTQALFYERADVFYGSVHVDPGAGWFPHHMGFADETGRDAGRDANLNLPLPPGTPDGPWLNAVARLASVVESFGATALVISLGVDAAADDPESPLEVSLDGYRQAGRTLGQLGFPTVAVQEGGYHLEALGGLVRATLEGLVVGSD